MGFKSTKEAMEYAQRSGLASVVPLDPERTRLERDVIDAAKEYSRYFFPPDAAYGLLPDSPSNRFLIAVDALLKFESSQDNDV